MASFNKAIICGHLGQDPKVKTLDSGKTVAELRVATSEKYGGEEKTEWHSVKVWEKSAEFCRDYLAKGSLVLVEGRIETSKWQDKDGVDRYTTEIIASRVQGLGKPSGQTAQSEPQAVQNVRETFAGGSSAGMDEPPF